MFTVERFTDKSASFVLLFVNFLKSVILKKCGQGEKKKTVLSGLLPLKTKLLPKCTVDFYKVMLKKFDSVSHTRVGFPKRSAVYNAALNQRCSSF